MVRLAKIPTYILAATSVPNAMTSKSFATDVRIIRYPPFYLERPDPGTHYEMFQ